MLVLALSDAVSYDIAAIVVWFVAFPALIMGLIGFALFQSYGERMENEEQARRTHRT